MMISRYKVALTKIAWQDETDYILNCFSLNLKRNPFWFQVSGAFNITWKCKPCDRQHSSKSDCDFYSSYHNPRHKRDITERALRFLLMLLHSHQIIYRVAYSDAPKNFFPIQKKKHFLVGTQQNFVKMRKQSSNVAHNS